MACNNNRNGTDLLWDQNRYDRTYRPNPQDNISKRKLKKERTSIRGIPIFQSTVSATSRTVPFYVDAYQPFSSSNKQEVHRPQYQQPWWWSSRSYEEREQYLEHQCLEHESEQNEQDFPWLRQIEKDDDFNFMLEKDLWNQLEQLEQREQEQLEMIDQRDQQQLQDFEMSQRWDQLQAEHDFNEHLKQIERLEQKENHNPS